ncbi:MAG: hypothetical protein GWM90_28395, partial [Gemmatimonadetes bacterium]|nr:hypothetical protein [Gemmatimonadota bacterium]NIQ58952.1 hypothetical protein [Gemmatimonadota bacterium]NIU79142.1 hypothetical protein [Gammaproteobacteria bacterium]NIX47847.1 hypothetical protein [Gemmatimonadota bacterium]NIY12212.1 hypothetical protein [Gemmatimonadota bacterium]
MTGRLSGITRAAAVATVAAGLTVPAGLVGDGAGPGSDAVEAGPAQDAEQAVMVAAARWALERLPRGRVLVDPHRSGQGIDETLVEAVARELDAGLGTLEETRHCADVMDPSTCALDAAALLAISAPQVDDGTARVRVYAWHAADSRTEPVGK